MGYNHKCTIAVLIDGGFFLKRYYRVYPGAKSHTPKQVVDNLYTMAHAHVEGNNLYRIFYYDCMPLQKRVHNPISKKVISFNTSPQAIFRTDLFEELKKKRKVALRLGTLKDSKNWLIRPVQTKELLSGAKTMKDITADDIYYDMKQRGIDMKIGVDIASLSFKKLVDRIILVAGDSDFVPASKLARREGIDFILDPMWNPIEATLFEHIDGLKSTCKKPWSKKKITGAPGVISIA